MTKIISFYNLIKRVHLNLIKLILVFLLLKTYPCFATNNLVISINDTKIILEGDFVQGGLVKGKINKDFVTLGKGATQQIIETIITHGIK